MPGLLEGVDLVGDTGELAGLDAEETERVAQIGVVGPSFDRAHEGLAGKLRSRSLGEECGQGAPEFRRLGHRAHQQVGVAESLHDLTDERVATPRHQRKRAGILLGGLRCRRAGAQHTRREQVRLAVARRESNRAVEPPQDPRHGRGVELGESRRDAQWNPRVGGVVGHRFTTGALEGFERRRTMRDVGQGVVREVRERARGGQRHVGPDDRRRS